MKERENPFQGHVHLEQGAWLRFPHKLVRPSTRVVRNARRLVEIGLVDSRGRQTVFVEDPKTGQAYMITDMNPNALDERQSNLLIEPIELDEMGELAKLRTGVVLPRNPDDVSAQSILSLRGITPKSMRTVARQLDRSLIIPAKISRL